MFAKIEIDRSRCKGCGLCTSVCPRLLLKLEETVAEPVQVIALVPKQELCVGCAQCAEMCPDLAINVSSRQKNEITGTASTTFRTYTGIVTALAGSTRLPREASSGL